MAKGMRLLRENMKVVDLFIMVLDSRVPVSSFNPNIEELTKGRNKKIIILLNKSDLADKEETLK
jgi:ribosome biogenesis GTPase A